MVSYYLLKHRTTAQWAEKAWTMNLFCLKTCNATIILYTLFLKGITKQTTENYLHNHTDYLLCFDLAGMQRLARRNEIKELQYKLK